MYVFVQLKLVKECRVGYFQPDTKKIVPCQIKVRNKLSALTAFIQRTHANFMSFRTHENFCQRDFVYIQKSIQQAFFNRFLATQIKFICQRKRESRGLM